jgi:hypothetical protein
MKARLFVLLIIISFPFLVWGGPSIGDAAKNILIPTEIITKLVLITCYILGAIFIFMSFAQYKVHRHSPKLVPLTTPILLFVLGLICAFIPFSSNIFGKSFSATEMPEAQRARQENLLPLPDASPRGPDLPIFRNQGQSEQNVQPPVQQEETPPSDEPDSGHWTSDPRYNP